MIPITIKLYPERLENPDLDIRYELPTLISQCSSGAVAEDGYDYEARDGENGPTLLLFLMARTEGDLAFVTDVLAREKRLGNKLSLAAEAFIERDGEAKCIFPT